MGECQPLHRGETHMGLYKRQTHAGMTWCIQYFANGRRVREAIGPSKRQAELVLAKRKADIREGRYFDTHKEKPLAFSVLADRYLKEHAAIHQKPRSYQRNVSSTKVLKSYFGDLLVKNITQAEIHSYTLARIEEGKAANTVNAEIGHLGNLFTWAMKMKLAVQNPVKGIAHLKGT